MKIPKTLKRTSCGTYKIYLTIISVMEAAASGGGGGLQRWRWRMFEEKNELRSSPGLHLHPAP